MKKIIYIFIAVTMLFVIVGCSNDDLGTHEIDNYTGEESVDISRVIEEDDIVGMFFAPVETETEEEWLANVGKVKFYENMTPDLASSWNFMPFDMTELFVPDTGRGDLELSRIWAMGLNSVNFSYSYRDARNRISISWDRHWGSDVPAREAAEASIMLGPISYEIVTHDGTMFGFARFSCVFGGPDIYRVDWAQYGKKFTISIPVTFPRNEIFEIARMKQLEAWELDGDAVSVSIQGMENVRIFEQSANREFLEATRQTAMPGDELIVIGDALYRGDLGRSMERVGYRWLIDENLGRYQYVLMPGMYTFRADGLSGTPGLTVRHFDGGEAVSVVDYSDRLIAENASGFYLTVTEDAGDTDLSYLSANHIFAVSSHDELRNAIQYHIDQGITEQTTITMTQDFTATGATIYVPMSATVDIILTSTPGNAFTYTRTTAGRHFDVAGGRVTLKDVIICGGTGTQERGGINVRGHGHLIMEEGSIIRNNRFISGGGVTTGGSGRFTMRGGIIEGNVATSRGGGVTSSSSVFTMYGGIIRYNTSAVFGGGVAVTGGGLSRLDMFGGVIESNMAVAGGGISVGQGIVNIHGTSETAIIRNNGAITNGGGVYFDTASRESTITSGAIINNWTHGSGGGLYISGWTQHLLHISDGFLISGNRAERGGDDIWVSQGNRGGMDVFADDAAGELILEAARAFAEYHDFDFEYIYELLSGNRQDHMLYDEYFYDLYVSAQCQGE
ncbi:MAG: hypothetical protein FWC75_09945 [Oscillospiraceae bacterium]|nr:hypothetical protein [Oscillospiraceae bacterium]